MRVSRSLSAAALVVGLTFTALTTTVSAAPASAPQQAARCGWNGDQVTGPVSMHYKAGAYFRTGPYAECSGYKTPNQGWAVATCRYVNSLGNLWYYSSDWAGWVYSGNVTFPIDGSPAPTKWC